MKINKTIYLLTFLSLSMLDTTEAKAEEILNTQQHSTIEVELLERPVSLTAVEPPKFTTYELSGREQTIQATSDLVIDIEDNRADGSTPWGIQYGLSIIENQTTNQKENNHFVLKLGTGMLSINGVTADKSNYEPRAVVLSQEKQSMIVQQKNSQKGTYQYRVPKENISIQLPKGTTSGQYKTTQIVTLIDLPVIK